MSSGAVWACCGGVLVGSGEFWWVLVSSCAVLVAFLWVLVSSGGFLWVLACSGAVLVCSGEFCWVLVGSGELWCNCGVFW